MNWPVMAFVAALFVVPVVVAYADADHHPLLAYGLPTLLICATAAWAWWSEAH